MKTFERKGRPENPKQHANKLYVSMVNCCFWENLKDCFPQRPINLEGVWTSCRGFGSSVHDRGINGNVTPACCFVAWGEAMELSLCRASVRGQAYRSLF